MSGRVLPEDVREFLTELTNGKSIDVLRVDAERDKNSADLDAGYISWVALRAAELLTTPARTLSPEEGSS